MKTAVFTIYLLMMLTACATTNRKLAALPGTDYADFAAKYGAPDTMPVTLKNGTRVMNYDRFDLSPSCYIAIQVDKNDVITAAREFGSACGGN